MSGKSIICLAFCLLLLFLSMGGAGADSERYTITIANWDAGNWGNDALADYLRERFNVDFKFIGLSTVDYIEKLNIMATGDTLPDIFMHPGYSGYTGTMLKWIEEDVIKALPDDLSPWPSLKKRMDTYSFMKVGGRHYFLPRTTFSNPDNSYFTPALWVHKDWMTALGIKEFPTTLEGFYDLAYKFTYDDPDGNGKQDTFGVTPGLGLEWVFSAYGIDLSGFILEDGQYIPGMLSKRCPEAIKFIKRMYDDGILDKDFATISLADSENNFASYRSGVCYLVGEAGPFQYVALAKLAAVKDDFNGETDLSVLPPPHADGYAYLCQQNYNFFSGLMFDAGISNAKMERCLDLLEFLLSEEGINFGRFGVEGISYNWVDGERKSLVTNSFIRSLFDVQPTYQIVRIVSWDTDGAWVNPEVKPEYSALAMRVRDLYGPYMNEWKPEIDFKLTPTKQIINLGEYFWSSIYKIILNNSDVDAEWAVVRDVMFNNKNGQKLIDEINDR